MRIISRGNDAVTAVCGKQKNIEGRIMRPSTYMVRTETDDGLLLYNTLTYELLLLTEDERMDDVAIRGKLIEKWFYVPEAFDECKYSEQIRSVMEMLNKKSDVLTDFTIFTTTDCDARCYYCFEKGARRLHMSDRIAHDTASFIIHSCRGKKVVLHWFGGEPLYNSRAIDIIVSDLIAAGIDYDSKMISNGYLFDDEMIRTAAEVWHLKRVQLTLDGTEQIYNRTKNYIYADNNAYARVLGNIGKLLKAGISVHIRLNLSRANYDDLMNLTDDLNSHFGGMEGLHVYAALLYDYIGIGNGYSNWLEAVISQKEMNDKLSSLGLSNPRLLREDYRLNQCMASNDHGVTVLPDGYLAKCEHDIDDGFIGNIYDGITDTELVRLWKERKPIQELCTDCPLFPQCSVRLKRCPLNQHDCTPERKARNIANLKKQINANWGQVKLDKFQNGDRLD